MFAKPFETQEMSSGFISASGLARHANGKGVKGWSCIIIGNLGYYDVGFPQVRSLQTDYC